MSIKTAFIVLFQPWRAQLMLLDRIKALKAADSELAKYTKGLLGEIDLLRASVQLHQDADELFRTRNSNEELTRKNAHLSNRIQALESAHRRLCELVDMQTGIRS